MPRAAAQPPPGPRPGPARPAPAADFAALSVSADAARDAGRLDEAVPLYRKALVVRPRWREGWWSLGTILYDQDGHAEAARAFRRLLVLDPKNGTAHLMLALCEYQLDRDASAMAHVQSAKALGVQKEGQLLQVLAYHEAMLLLRAGRYERALDVLQSLVVEGVEDESLDLALGLGVLLRRPKDAPAEGSPERQVVLRAGRAERHAQAKEFTEASARFDELMREAASFPNMHYAFGRFLLKTDDLERAVAQFQQAIDADPTHVRAHMQIAAARYRSDSAAGIPYAQTVVTLAPGYPFGHYLLGLLYLDSGDPGRALPELETAARLVPTEAQFHFALGNAYANVGRKHDAARARATFLRLQGADTATSRRESISTPPPARARRGRSPPPVS